ncbi:MAG: AraC family transcriptional regulator [Erysipelotrichaceae bacterium]|nr:AraC family transcriptional regulator [Erysipelotrichaceae bacterium]
MPNYMTADRKVYLDPTPLKTKYNVKEIYQIFTYLYTPSFSYMGESHEPMELVYVQQGSITVSTARYSLVLNDGDMLIHRPWDYHRVKANGVQCHVMFFTFKLTGGKKAPDELCDRIVHADEIDQFYLKNIYHQGIKLISHNVDGKSLGSNESYYLEQEVKDSLELLLLRIASPCPATKVNQSGQSPSKSSKIVTKVLTYLNDNIDKTIRLEDIAKLFNYSVSRISAVFKKEMNDSVMSYFVKMKIKKACELIALGTLSLKDISDSLSYDNVQYFSTQFKKVTGLTPGQFRSQSAIDVDYQNIVFEKV